MKSNKSKICVICGVNESTTSDHVPPKNLFPKPRPQLITVPACSQCNNLASDYDEKLMLYISLQIGPEEIRTKQLWKNKALKSLKRNKRFQREIVGQMKEVSVADESGQRIKKVIAFLAEESIYYGVFERIVRGFYFHHFHEILGPNVSFMVQPSAFLPDEIFEASENLAQNEIGDEAFIYRYGRTLEELGSTLWVFQFYKKHWVIVTTTETKAQPDNQPDC